MCVYVCVSERERERERERDERWSSKLSLPLLLLISIFFLPSLLCLLSLPWHWKCVPFCLSTSIWSYFSVWWLKYRIPLCLNLNNSWDSLEIEKMPVTKYDMPGMYSVLWNECHHVTVYCVNSVYCVSSFYRLNPDTLTGPLGEVCCRTAAFQTRSCPYTRLVSGYKLLCNVSTSKRKSCLFLKHVWSERAITPRKHQENQKHLQKKVIAMTQHERHLTSSSSEPAGWVNRPLRTASGPVTPSVCQMEFKSSNWYTKKKKTSERRRQVVLPSS